MLWTTLFLLALPVLLLALLATDGGTGWALRQSVELLRDAGVEVRLVHRSGSLLGRLELDDLAVAAADSRLEIGHLVLDWRPRALLDGRLQVRLIAASDVHLVPPPATESEPGQLQIPDLVLPLAVQVDRLLLERVVIEQPDGAVGIDRLAAVLSLDRQGLALRQIEFAGSGARLDGEVSMQASAPHAVDGGLNAHIDEQLSGADIGAVSVRAVLSGSALRPAFDLRVETPAQLHLQGSALLDQPQPGFDLAAEWTELNWPLRGVPQVATRNGRITLEGMVDDYRLNLRASVQGPDLPPGDVSLAAQGDLNGLRLQPLGVVLKDGRLQAEGSLSWDAGTRWQLELLAEKLNPAMFAADWPGEISGHLRLAGSLDQAGERLAAQAHIDGLTGRLRGYPVKASGALDWDAGRLRAEALDIASGPNRIKLDGRVDDRLDLRFAIEAPDLASLYPGLGGRLHGDGQLGGTRTQPSVVGKFSGAGLGYEGLRAQQFDLSVDWRDDKGSGRARLTGLDLDGQVVNGLSADLDGDLAMHRLKLAADGPEFAFTLSAQGGLIGQVWQGELRALTASQAALGEWRLRAPASLRLAADEVRSGRLCLVQGATDLCAGGGWGQAAGLDVAGQLNKFDLAKLAPLLPNEAKIKGSLSGEFSARGPTAAPNLTFDLRPGDGRIRLEADPEPFDLAYRNARINGRFENDRGSADLRFDLGPNGSAAGGITLGAAQEGRRALGGELKADFPDLGLIAGFVPALEEVEGRLAVSAKLGGTLDAPRISGGLQVSEASARVPAAGILVDGIGLSVNGDGVAPLQVRGRASSGGGRLDLKGSVDLAGAGGPAVDLSVRGKDFEALKQPEAHVTLSPDLRLQGDLPYHLSGTLRIPKATIKLEELPAGTVAVSDDEIVVGEHEEAAPAPQVRNLTAKVRVELGKAVTFEGFGLKTGLTGALDATEEARGVTVDGKIEMRDGHYKAYGQDLQVELGRLLFAGPPGNPDVDLRALRVSRDGDTKAYLALTGPLSKPRARVYSVPALPEAQALAYLMTGRGLDQARQEEGQLIASAALAFGVAQSEPLLLEMSDRLGLDDLRVESGENGLEDTSLVLGKYLNPDLYLGYSQGLFSPEGAILLRLKLSKRLELESRSGIQQSVDLLYRLEHN